MGLNKPDFDGGSTDMSGVIAIGNAIPTMGALVKFDISNNKLSMEGGKAIAEALKGTSIITDLNIASNNLGLKADLSALHTSGVIAIGNAILMFSL